MELSSSDIAKLLLNEWLNDSMVNAYGALLQKRAAQNPGLPRIFVVDSFFYSSYLQNSPRHVPGRFRAVDIHQLDFIRIPCNIGNAHWLLSVIDLRSHLNQLDFILIPCNIGNVHWLMSVIDLGSHLMIVYDSIYND